MNKREQQCHRASTEVFDIAIIGGGITGAGIALTAAKNGWKTIIIDKNDFASGTSSRSAKMVHGGLRYLEQFQIGLVKEALHEREHLLKIYPHLVKPQPFFMPIYKSKFSKLKLGIGLTLYDKLSGKKSKSPKHKSLNTSTIQQRFPQLKTDKMVGGFIYFDAKTNDARLTNEVIQNAEDLGAVALNYADCLHFEKNNNLTHSIICKDNLSNKQFSIQAKLFIIATGIWTDDTLKKYNADDVKKYMAPSKGIHLVVSANHLPKDCVMILPTSNGDGRFLWCMPWEDNLNIIGTTDTDYKGNIEEIQVEQNEINYILDSVNAQLRNSKLTENDILSVFAGIRPLLNDDDEDKKSNKRSRDYKIWWNNENTLTISGGKFTSFLSMAEHCLETVKEKLDYSSNQIQENIDILIAEKWQPLLNKYEGKYGDKNAKRITSIVQDFNDIELTKQDKKYPYSDAEFIFFIRFQNALKIDDLLTRRTLVTYQMKNFDAEYVSKIATIMAKELDWNDTQKLNEINDYKNAWQLMHSWH
ncbi:MAG: glycerol-3-phosphate dehydrogenase/oxidase [Bacteroidetes bacterium]|nr:glycerol-3-phosphate dehydrogenase/oxidase [Bacteroidota bacterium]